VKHRGARLRRDGDFTLLARISSKGIDMTATPTSPATPAQPRIREVDPATVRGWIERGEAVLVDVREPDEHARERIEQAKLVPLSTLDPAALAVHGAKRLVLHCAGGRRSLEAAGRVAPMCAGEVYSMQGGIGAWKKAGLPLAVNARAPIPIMRQVQITAGSMVFIGTLLGAFVDPWWLIVPGFVGAGLVFAGATGTCGMARMLSLMPWNRIETCSR
jgi:rhodanese-related sulfurtransferase